MSNLSNEKDILNQENIYQENQNDNINDEHLQNFDMGNNLDINDFDKNLNNNTDINNTQEAFVQTLNLQIKQLQELLDNKNKEFDNLNNENNKLKLLLIQGQKKLIDRENNIHSINIIKKDLEEKINKYKIESESMQSKIKELNYKIIELNQNIISKENLSQFSNKIKNVLNSENTNVAGNNNNEEKINAIINEKYEIELKRLSNLIDELEIKNNRLNFDNKTLNNKIDNITKDKNNEMNIYKTIYQNQINNLNKIITNLNNRISQLFSEKKIIKNFGGGSNLIKKEIMEKFNELENKLNIYDKENCDLRKENQTIKNELEELKLVGDSKEKIIQKLQTDFELMENEYNNNLATTQKIDENDMNKSQYINELINKQKSLKKENNDLKFGLKQMTKNINEANQLYFKKKAEYDKTLEVRDNKLKEYRKKISLLKMKINELHQEINLLKEIKGDFLNSNNNNNVHYSFLTQNNNDLNIDINKINKRKNEKKLRSFTPKARGNKYPFEINLDNKNGQNNEIINENNDIFGDIKISEVKKENTSIRPVSINKNNNEKNNDDKNEKKNLKIDIAKLGNNEQELKYLQEYKDTLNKIDEQLNKFKS